MGGAAHLDPRLRRATIEDAQILAELVSPAGEGLPLYLWSRLAGPGETAGEIGRRRATREEGAFFYRTVTMSGGSMNAAAWNSAPNQRVGASRRSTLLRSFARREMAR